MTAKQITVRTVDGGQTLKDWIATPYTVFADDPNWIAQLDLLEKHRISRKSAPFFTFGEAEFFVAYRDGKPVGRISAQVNHRHLEVHHDNSGHFGFFECVDDPDVARALIEAASSWIKSRGLARIEGPFSLSINEECGCLIAGFDSPPAMLMPHGRPWFGPLLEKFGMTKVTDLFAYRTKPTATPTRIEQLAIRATERFKNISLRQWDTRRWRAEIDLLVDIYNDAWGKAWGFVPFSTAEIDALATELRPFFRNEYGRFLLIDGKEVGFAAGIPDINSIIAPFHGHLLPFNWARLLWSLKREKAKSLRIPFLGVRQAWQTSPLGSSLVVLLVRDLSIQAATRYDINWAEFSWVRETDPRMMALGEATAGPPAKTYRIYGKAV
jgi:hypothetical protein